MLLIKSFITVSCIILLIIMTGCAISSLFYKTDVFRCIFMAQVSAIICTLTFVLEINTNIPHKALLYRSINFCFIDFCLLLFFFFVTLVEQNHERSKKAMSFRRVGVTLIFIDCLLFAVNYFHPFFFRISPVFYKGAFYCWNYRLIKHGLLGIPYHFHMLLNYLLAASTVFYLVKVIKKTKSIYRIKYHVLLCVFVAALIVNALYIFLRIRFQTLIDYSILAYGFLSGFAFFVAYYSGPQRVLRNVLIVSAQAIGDAVVCFDMHGEKIYENAAARKIFSDPSNRTWLRKFMDQNEGRPHMISAMEVFTVDNAFRDYKYEYNVIFDKRNRYCGAYLKFNDRTDEIKKIEEETYRATHDELTGLYNRGYFFSKMEDAVLAEPDSDWLLLCTDIKNFKLINNLFGTENGDLLLKYQAKALMAANYAECIRGRISGDHFAMLIKKEHFKPELAAKSTEEIQKAISDKNFKLQINIGVYEIADPYENVHTMYDKAMLAIKKVDSDLTTLVSYYDISLMNNLVEEKNILSEFDTALKNEQFCMFLQPQIKAKDGKCIGAEALVRWYDGEGKYRSPGTFIKVLEKGGYIYKLDHYIWEKAVQKLAAWEEEGIDAYISVNISARDFYYADLYADLTTLVEKYEVAPSRLNLEITETVLFDTNSKYPMVLEKLRTYGFKVEMDDFGTGYSSLSKLKDLQMDVLKIDMNFLTKSDNKERAMLIIHSIIKMAKALKMYVVCEGVETEEQVEFLKQSDIDAFQGYFFSKPVPVEEFEHKYLKGKN